MKKTLLIAALAVFTITSCSKDQVVEIPQDAIKYSVVTDNATKASAVYCQNNLMTSFKVYAQDASGKAYIQGDEIKEIGGTWTSEVRRYWPEGNSLDFYAVVNTENVEFNPSADMGNAIAKITSFTPAEEVGNQLDLLYAVDMDQTKESAPVKLNFRHALSQIEFRAQNLNKNLYVEIKTVKVGKVYASGSYLLPNAATSNVMNNGDHDQSEVMTSETRGNWTFGTEKTDYTVAVYATTGNLKDENAAAVIYNQEPVSLTLSNDKDNVSKSMLLLPTVNNTDTDGLEAWNPTAGLADYNGTYLGVECVFYNVPSGVATADNIVKIDEGWAYLPVDLKWEEGKKYIYTFKFTTDGNGGYEPDPDDPEPVLTPITYTVTVDDFENGGNTDLEMKK